MSRRIGLISILGVLFSLVAWAAEPWEEKIEDSGKTYLLKVAPKDKKIQVIAEKEGDTPHLRVRIHRKNDRPLDLSLKTLEPKDGGVNYTGHLDAWNDSMVGFQLQMSFDKKTWKNLGKKINRVIQSIP